MDCLIEDRVRVDGYVDVNVCIVISHMCLHVIEIERARRKRSVYDSVEFML